MLFLDYLRERKYRVMPMNPTVRPAIEDATATKLRNSEDWIKLMTIKKGRTAPRMSSPKPIPSSLEGFSISDFYL